jgi:hypothetical protein
MLDQIQSTEQTQNTQTKKPWYKKWWVIGIGVLFLYSIVSNSFNEAREKAKEVKTTNTGTEQADNNAVQQQKNEESFNYEIIKKIPGGTTLVMRIYTTEKEGDRIIRLTDKLLNENKGLTHLNIEYFDDKELAMSYFDKQMDDTISRIEKDKMFTHYIASLTYNTVSGYKVLKKNQNNDWVELKKY